MGRIFSAKAVRKGRVPTKESFAIAENRLGELLRRSSNHQKMAALVFGSVGKGEPSRRSDFDFLFYYPDHLERLAIELVDEFRQITKRLDVAIDPIFLAQSDATSGQNDLTPGFMIHLRELEHSGLYLNYPFLEGVQVASRSIHQELIDYLVRKRQIFRHGLALGQPTDIHQLRYLQKILELPVHAARRYLQSQGSLTDTKSEVINDFQDFEDREVVKIFNDFLTLDQDYTQAMEYLLDNEGNKDFAESGYHQKLGEIERSASQLLVFINRLLRWLDAIPA